MLFKKKKYPPIIEKNFFLSFLIKIILKIFLLIYSLLKIIFLSLSSLREKKLIK